MTALFWYGLALKVAMTVSIVVAASVLVERSGPFIGALIAALPTAGGAAYIILGWEHPASFVAASTVGSLVSNAVCLFFALSFALSGADALVACESRWRLCRLAVSCGVDAICRLDNDDGALLLNVVSYPLTIYAGTQFRAEGARTRVTNTFYDLVWRAAVVTACVIVVTAASSSIGSFASGLFAFFPVAMGSFFLILYVRVGGPAAASVAAHVQAPLIGLGLSLIAVHYLAEPVGVWWSYLIALTIGVSWNGLLWLLRSRRR